MLNPITKKIFFHELGHFVALKINRYKYNGADIKDFKVPKATLNRIGRIGGITLVEGNVNQSKESLAHHLAACIYGCFFQSYFLKTELIDCFMAEPTATGSEDYSRYRDALNKYGLAKLECKLMSIEEKYYQSLLERRLLEKFIGIDVQKFIENVEDEQDYNVNIELLRQELEKEILEHITIYSGLIEQYEAILLK